MLSKFRLLFVDWNSMSFLDSARALIGGLETHGYRDRAVFYTILSRITSICLGPLVVLAVGSLLGPEERGIYFVFGSLLQLRGLIDLGFSQSSQQLLANRFADLNYDKTLGVSGNTLACSQFFNLAKYTCKAYWFIGLVNFIVVGSLGYLFLYWQLDGRTNVHWQGAWWVMMACVGIGLGSCGIVVVADGANQLGLTNRYRFWSELFAIFVFLVVIAIGGGLWASASMAFARLWLPIPISRNLGQCFRKQVCNGSPNEIDFYNTILPLQLRNMVVWGLGFFCYYAYNPLVLWLLGPASAGIVGMTLQIANMTSGISSIWYNTKLSKLGNLAGSNDYLGVMDLNRKGLKFSMISWLIISVSILSLFFVLKPYIFFLSSLGSPFALAMFLLGSGAFIWNHTRASMIRAFCVEVFTALAIVQSLLTPLLLWFALPRFGTDGAAVVYFLVMSLGAIWSEFAQRSFTKYNVTF